MTPLVYLFLTLLFQSSLTLLIYFFPRQKARPDTICFIQGIENQAIEGLIQEADAMYLRYFES